MSLLSLRFVCKTIARSGDLDLGNTAPTFGRRSAILDKRNSGFDSGVRLLSKSTQYKKKVRVKVMKNEKNKIHANTETNEKCNFDCFSWHSAQSNIYHTHIYLQIK